MLCAVGDLVEDIVVRFGAPIVAGTDNAARVDRVRGGSAANVAAFAASTGAAVRFVGRVGDDEAGRVLAGLLVAAGVDARVQFAGRTGSVVVLVEPSGERTMFPDRGAATELADVDPAWTVGVTWLHVPGYSLVAEPVGATTLGLVDAVRDAGGRVSVDISSVGAVERFGRERFGAVLRQIAPDLVLATAAEAQLAALPAGALLVVKDAAAPVTVAWPGGRRERVPVDAVDAVIDTTGAGDAFAAGFVLATIDGAEPVDAVRAGSRLAATTLGVAGAGTG